MHVCGGQAGSGGVGEVNYVGVFKEGFIVIMCAIGEGRGGVRVISCGCVDCWLCGATVTAGAGGIMLEASILQVHDAYVRSDPFKAD